MRLRPDGSAWAHDALVAAAAHSRPPDDVRALVRLLAAHATNGEPVAINPTLYSTAEAAEQLGVSARTVRRRCDDGTLDAQRVGRELVIFGVRLRPQRETG